MHIHNIFCFYFSTKALQIEKLYLFHIILDKNMKGNPTTRNTEAKLFPIKTKKNFVCV